MANAVIYEGHLKGDKFLNRYVSVLKELIEFMSDDESIELVKEICCEDIRLDSDIAEELNLFYEQTGADFTKLNVSEINKASLIYKLAPMDEKMRKLNNVRKLWEGILDVREVRDVFTGNPIVSKQYDVDHFIPWSFVMNDELWNLMPMDSSLNSSKSNKLPKWDPFFIVFAENQFGMYKLIHEKEELHKRFEACYRDNLHSIWAGQELYRPGNTKEEFYNILQKNMQPVYDSARRQGYEIWNYQLL